MKPTGIARLLSVILAALAIGAACDSAPTAPTSAASGSLVSLGGLVNNVTGTCPNLTFTAGGDRVTTAATTAYAAGGCVDVKRGSLVEVDGRQSTMDLVLASTIKVESGVAGGLLSDVAGGGYVLFFRHAERNTAVLSTTDLAAVDNRGECVPGSELTPNGTADATALGERFKRYGIRVQKVYASPTCRTVQMARLAFGDGFETTRALTWPGMWSESEGADLAPALRRLLGTPPEPKKNIVLIAHNDVLKANRIGIDVVLDQAEAAVFRPTGGESFEYLGKISRAEWMGTAAR